MQLAVAMLSETRQPQQICSQPTAVDLDKVANCPALNFPKRARQNSFLVEACTQQNYGVERLVGRLVRGAPVSPVLLLQWRTRGKICSANAMRAHQLTCGQESSTAELDLRDS